MGRRESSGCVVGCSGEADSMSHYFGGCMRLDHVVALSIGRMIPADLQIKLGLVIPEGKANRNVRYVVSCFHAYRIVAHKVGHNGIFPVEAPSLAEAVRAAVKL